MYQAPLVKKLVTVMTTFTLEICDSNKVAQGVKDLDQVFYVYYFLIF